MKPRQVKAWLDQLPTSEPLVWALEVLKFLTACNRSDLANDRRQQVLELIEPTLGKACESLRALYLQTPPPLDMRNHHTRQPWRQRSRCPTYDLVCPGC